MEEKLLSLMSTVSEPVDNNYVTADVENQRLSVEERPTQPITDKEMPKCTNAEQKPGKCVLVAEADEDHPNSQSGKGSKRTKLRQPFTHPYSEQEIENLIKIRKVFHASFNRLIADDRVPFTKYSEYNAVFNLTEAINNGLEVAMPAMNRQHGQDQKKTGESIMEDGAQALLLVVPNDVAWASGVEIVRFPTDKNQGAVTMDGFTLINGNGRMGYLLGLEPEKRPILYATLIEPDSEGFYNIPRAMSAINEHRSQWKTQDKLQKKIMEAGKDAHKLLIKTRELVNKGYNYQAACQLTTLLPDRITSSQLENGDFANIFRYGDQAEKVRDALISKFGEGDDKTLKTKPFSMEICRQFALLLKACKKMVEETGAEEGDTCGKSEKMACDYMTSFIRNISDKKVREIKAAKKSKAPGSTKDFERVKLLNNLFNQFIGKENLEID